MNELKIAILFDRFGPYHIARIKGAMAHAEILAVEAVPHRGVYDWTPPKLPDGLAYIALTKAKGEEVNLELIERRLDELLGGFKADVIALPGWSNMITLAVLRWCIRHGVPTVCMSETNEWDFKRTWFKEKIKSGIVRHYSAGLATNDSQVRYLAKLGIRNDAIFRGYNAIDNTFFRTEAEKYRAEPELPADIAAIIPADARGKYFLASNRFIPKKNLSRLLDAYAEFRLGRSHDPADWPLVLLGDGDLRAELEAKIATLGLSEHVHLPGFLQVDALPRFYATAGAFIHASTTEQWGLVVNEAMASRLPVAVSNRCGSAQFLIENDVTGYCFDPFKVDQIVTALNKLSVLPQNSALVVAADAKVEEVSPAAFGSGLANAAQAALAAPAQPGIFSRCALEFAILRAAHAERS